MNWDIKSFQHTLYLFINGLTIEIKYTNKPLFEIKKILLEILEEINPNIIFEV